MFKDDGKLSFRLYLGALFFVFLGVATMAVFPVMADAAVADETNQRPGAASRFVSRVADAVTFDPAKQAYLDISRTAYDIGRVRDPLCVETFTPGHKVRAEIALRGQLLRMDRIYTLISSAQSSSRNLPIVLSGVGVRREHQGQSWDHARFIQEADMLKRLFESFQRALTDDAVRRNVCGLAPLVPAPVVAEEISDEPVFTSEIETIELGSVDLVQMRGAIQTVEQDERFHPALRAYAGSVGARVKERIDSGETVHKRTQRRIISTTVTGRR